MAEFISKKQVNQVVSLYNINGEITNKLNEAVAKKVVDGDEKSYYIRLQAGMPVHHERFKDSYPLVNPTLVKVDSASYTIYDNYLRTKKEGFYTQLKGHMKIKGYI